MKNYLLFCLLFLATTLTAKASINSSENGYHKGEIVKLNVDFGFKKVCGELDQLCRSLNGHWSIAKIKLKPVRGFETRFSGEWTKILESYNGRSIANIKIIKFTEQNYVYYDLHVKILDNKNNVTKSSIFTFTIKELNHFRLHGKTFKKSNGDKYQSVLRFSPGCDTRSDNSQCIEEIM